MTAKVTVRQASWSPQRCEYSAAESRPSDGRPMNRRSAGAVIGLISGLLPRHERSCPVPWFHTVRDIPGASGGTACRLARIGQRIDSGSSDNVFGVKSWTSLKTSFLCFLTSLESTLSPLALRFDKSRNAFALKGTRCTSSSTVTPPTVLAPAAATSPASRGSPSGGETDGAAISAQRPARTATGRR